MGTLEEVETGFTKAVTAAFQCDTTKEDTNSLTSKVLQHVILFCEGPQMPRTVKYTACEQGDEKTEARKEIVQGLGKMVSKFKRIIGSSYPAPAISEDNAEIGADELRAALVLSLDFSF